MATFTFLKMKLPIARDGFSAGFLLSGENLLETPGVGWWIAGLGLGLHFLLTVKYSVESKRTPGFFLPT